MNRDLEEQIATLKDRISYLFEDRVEKGANIDIDTEIIQVNKEMRKLRRIRNEPET
jgi:hypothetical protein